MAEYKHGVYVTEQATSVIAPVESTAGLQVVVGTAPVHMTADPAAAVNKPIICYSLKEATAALGYSSDFEKYTLCEAMAASFQVMNVAPVVFINVLDPTKHVKDFEEITVQVNSGVAVVEAPGLLVSSLTVKNGTEEEDAALTAGTDYVATQTEEGVSIALVTGGAANGATSLKVSGKQVDPTKVTAEDIVGGVDLEGNETGMEVIRQVFPKLGLVPGILLAPRWSKDPTVAAALQGKCRKINGSFDAICIIDVDCSTTGAKKYTDVKTVKERQALTSAYAYAAWPYVKIGDTIYSGSVMAAALTVSEDADNGDIPSTTPSNKVVTISAACLEDGTEVLLDQEQANMVNSFGVATWLNMQGFRLWGTDTCIYPNNTDPKDRWFNIRRFFNWDNATFILTYFQKVDKPLNKRLIESIVDSENQRGNSFISRGICGSYSLQYLDEENPTTNLLAGSVVFHKYMSPFPPAKDIEEIVEFDADGLSAALSA